MTASTEFSRLNREQRAAYLAWQAAPAGAGDAALAAYLAASNQLAEFYEAQRDKVS